MKKFKDKKLLILGTSTASIEIVEYARSEGAYVIVADYLPVEKSAAKQVADEAVLISTTDVDSLCKYGEEKGIDGVFCGVSEINLLSAYKVAERLNLPCYFNMQQWECTENKAEFKKLCEKFSVPVARKYDLSDHPTVDELRSIKYPVIVKPTDRSACIGIHICHNDDELLCGYRDAYSMSLKHEVIVEEYLVGDEFTAYYDIIDGECRLVSMGDKYLNYEQKDLTPLPEAFLFPSKHLNLYRKNADPYVKNMIASLNLKCGTIFLQGITDGKNIAIFEAGLRINGSEMYKVVDAIGGMNAMQVLVDYALTGEVHAEFKKSDPTFNGKRVCYLYIVNKGGKIAKTTDCDAFVDIPGVVDCKIYYQSGDVIPRTGTLKQRQMRFCLICDDAKQLKHSIEQIQEKLCVLDVAGNNMLLTKFNADKVIAWDAELKKQFC